MKAFLDQTTPSGRLVALYLLVMPLLAGLPRGQLVPFIRVTEAAQIGLTGLAALIAFGTYSHGTRWHFELTRVDWAMAGVALFGSIVPIASTIARGNSVDIDVAVAAFALLKYFFLYVFARCAVRTAGDVRTAILAAITSGLIVATLAVPESLGIGPTGDFTRSIFANENSNQSAGRAFTTLGSAIASGTILAMSAALALGFAVRHKNVLAGAASSVLVIGALATGQATAVIGVVVIMLIASSYLGVLKKVAIAALPALGVSFALLGPVIDERLASTGSRSLVPSSWRIRWVNISELFWPDIADGGWIIGVDPRTTVLPPDIWRSEVFLESGYLWLLWVGGLPLLITFSTFIVLAWRGTARRAETQPTFEVARVGARAAIGFIAVMSIIDPHQTLRGGADLFYVLVALALAHRPLSVRCYRRAETLNHLFAGPPELESSTARLQIGEIGGPLLDPGRWVSVAPIGGVDQGIDVSINDCGAVVAEARLNFIMDGSCLRGAVVDSINATDEQSRALAWRAIAICSASMRLRSLDVPRAAGGVSSLERHEVRAWGATARLLEQKRLDPDMSNHRKSPASPSRSETQHRPVGVRLGASSAHGMWSRFFDLALSGSAMVATAPVALAAAVWIHFSSPGPILFRQMRLGAGGQPFRVLKFRTMDNSAGGDVHRLSIETAMARGEPDAKIEADPRITSVGAVLRKTSLDELPQLLNVWRGEMTLVGPRPSLLWESSLFASSLRGRLSVKPGIAGLWQASGRGALSTEEMLELDLRYVETKSAMTDTKLLAKTAVAVVRRKGAV